MSGSRVVLGVCGGIAAYKTVQVLRDLLRAGCEVRVIATPSALKMVGLTTWQALSENSVYTDIFSPTNRVEHTYLGEWADLVLVVPATADFLARYRQGRSDDPLGATLLSTRAPVMVCPAMHPNMWTHPATQDNVAVLRERDVYVLPPATGALTGGDSGVGRLPDPQTILAHAQQLLGPQDLRGQRVLVSAGGTREPIDPVRHLGNESSGRQGCAVAAEAFRRGAEVTLVAANICPSLLPPGVRVEPVVTTAELRSAMHRNFVSHDYTIMCAAVADFRPRETSVNKIQRQNSPTLNLELVANPDILAELVELRAPHQRVIGFGAQTGSIEEVLEAGVAKARTKQADLLCINRVGQGRGFGDVANELFILDNQGSEVGRARGSKTEVSQGLWETVLGLKQNEQKENNGQ